MARRRKKKKKKKSRQFGSVTDLTGAAVGTAVGVHVLRGVARVI